MIIQLNDTSPKTNPDNGLIDIKMSDFGVYNVLGETVISIILNIPITQFTPGQTPSFMYHAAPGGGTVCYLAPEVLRGDDPHTSADMWSLGALITYIANDGKHLFRRERDVFNWREDKSPMGREFQYPLHDLVLSLLSVDKCKRPSAEDIIKDSVNHLERQIEN